MAQLFTKFPMFLARYVRVVRSAGNEQHRKREEDRALSCEEVVQGTIIAVILITVGLLFDPLGFFSPSSAVFADKVPGG